MIYVPIDRLVPGCNDEVQRRKACATTLLLRKAKAIYDFAADRQCLFCSSDMEEARHIPAIVAPAFDSQPLRTSRVGLGVSDSSAVGYSGLRVVRR